jgi:hypothetical protein
MLEKSLTSLLDHSRHPDQIEIMIAYDDDDQDSKDYFSGFAWSKFISHWPVQHQISCVPRWGYRELHKYINMLAQASKGKWIFFWSDDPIMETKNWDDHVRANEDFVGLLHIGASNAPVDCSILPLFHRSWLDLFGCVSPVNHADSWMSEICRRAEARIVIPVTIFHDRFENSGNNRDETWEDKRRDMENGSSSKDYYLPESKRLRLEWAEKLRNFRQNL